MSPDARQLQATCQLLAERRRPTGALAGTTAAAGAFHGSRLAAAFPALIGGGVTARGGGIAAGGIGGEIGVAVGVAVGVAADGMGGAPVCPGAVASRAFQAHRVRHLSLCSLPPHLLHRS